jgi:hypothetical protein
LRTTRSTLPAVPDRESPASEATLPHRQAAKSRAHAQHFSTSRKFGGVAISDDIGMHATDGIFDHADAPIRFMSAGNDMLMLAAAFKDRPRETLRSIDSGCHQEMVSSGALYQAGTVEAM